MLRYALPRHVHVLAQLVERAAVVCVQQVKKLPPAGVRQRLEQCVGVGALCHVVHASIYLHK